MKKKMPAIKDKTVKEIAGLIISRVSPEKLVLFGSRARGGAAADSDIDLLIIKKQLKNERTITRYLYKVFLEKNITASIDLVAVDYDKYNKLKNDSGYIYKTIAREGQILYG